MQQAKNNNSPVLEARQLHRYLGGDVQRMHVLRGVDLSIFPSTVNAISGPSGCGKSTLLYLLGLLDQQDQGEIFINGQEMSNTSDKQRTVTRNQCIGFVFQFHFLLAEFTAAENIILPMRKLGKLKPKEMKEKAHHLLEEVGIADKRNRLAKQLSGGEQQRVAIARSLANDPALILADEPTGNLDVKNSHIVFSLLKKLAKQNQQAVVVVTHNPDIAQEADIHLTMSDGEFQSCPPSVDVAK